MVFGALFVTTQDNWLPLWMIALDMNKIPIPGSQDTYGAGQEGAAVLLPGFAIIW